MGGQGVFTSIPSYLKILKSILVDDGKLLSQRMVEMMFTPQLSSQSRAAIQKVFSIREASRNYIAEYIETAPYDWGLGGMLTLDNVGWARRKGTMTWSGLPNLFWFIDREADLCGVYGGQVLMNGDPQTF
ncbi:hypothetical protein DIZ76_016181 [Coccidioides immitis]|nr:hypothetical protein DIZ76_016181 [Coccidioides immitis]